MSKQWTCLVGVLWWAFCVMGQNQPPATPAEPRLESFQQRKALEARSVVRQVPFKSVGPTVFGGRVADIEVWEADPSHFYVAYASGGLWKTENNGASFEPLFDHQAVMTLGDIAVDWERGVIWAGTGEVNSSRSSYAGAGIWKSTDDGASWQHMGLAESHHIGRIVLHPTDPHTLWVAVLGHLYSPNEERGVYKTTDGGHTWKRVLFVDENTGAVDLVLDPADPNVLYAATWERTRRAWNFVESGQGSGIWKSTDGGESWQRLNTARSGFPTGEGVGRIGLALSRQQGRTVVYAVLDNYFRRPKEAPEPDVLTKDMLRHMSRDEFLGLKKYLLEAYLQRYRFPKKYDADTVIELVRKGEIVPKDLVDYVEDANSLLFDTEVIGAEVYRSDDGGHSWKKLNQDYLDNVFNSYGYYFGQIRVAPWDPDRLYIMGVPILRSDDGGKTWKSIDGDNVHVDHHALWINPNRKGHLILGNDGGVNISYDDGAHWIKCNTPAVGQFYSVALDMEEPYNIYGGLQDNGVWYGPSTYEHSTRWHGTGHYPYKMLLGGDGMQVAVDTRDNATIYTGFQFGNYFRIDKRSGRRKYITPRHELGERPLRWNWETPIHLSVHNQDILYMGANKLFRSLDRGDHFEAISGDLTKGGRKGDVSYGTLTCVHESPLRFGLIYTGSDDGLVHVTRDGGYSWQRISDSLPQDMWVSCVQASAHEEGRVYLALNGYRWDYFEPMVYVSENYGRSWQRIGSDLPLEPVNVIKEDPKNPEVLYLGTDHALYVSLDRGQSFMRLGSGLPDVAVHDLAIHPREAELVVATHGRSFYKGYVGHVQQLTDSLMAKPLHLFELEPMRYSSRWGNGPDWMERDTPRLVVPMWVGADGEVELTILAGELPLVRARVRAVRGLAYPELTLAIEQAQAEAYEAWLNKDRKEDQAPIRLKPADDGRLYLRPGSYELVVEKDGYASRRTFVLK